MPIRVGVQVQPQHAEFSAMRRAWRDVEELGADTIYTWDHFYPLSGDPDGKHFEGVVSLAALVGYRACANRCARVLQLLPQPPATRRCASHH